MRSWDRTLSSDFRALPGTSHATHPPGLDQGSALGFLPYSRLRLWGSTE